MITIRLIIILVSFYSFLPSAVLSDSEVTLVSEVEWQMLNPARGDKSPQAATLWGDRNGVVPTGFLVKFVDGFSSPPHIHNVSYRGVVIDGRIHNDDPNAEELWMPNASFWTQPAGEAHITAAMGESNLAYIEIDTGPYLVRPTEKAFDNGERPVNIDASNIVWLNVEGAYEKFIQLAYLWGQPQKGQQFGMFVKLPAGVIAKLTNLGDKFHAVLIRGELNYIHRDMDKERLLPGSYFTAKQDAVHKLDVVAAEDSILYVRTNGEVRFE